MFGSQSAKNGDPRISKILDSQGVKYEVDKDSDFKVIYNLGNGRSQVAFINSNTEEFAGVEVRDVWSIGLAGDGQLSAEVANSLLARNSRYKVGGWQVSQEGGKVLAIFKVCLSADASASELMAVVETVLQIADQVEKEYLESDLL